MASAITENTFIVWGADRTAYGPVELPTLVAWVKDERVMADPKFRSWRVSFHAVGAPI